MIKTLTDIILEKRTKPQSFPLERQFLIGTLPIVTDFLGKRIFLGPGQACAVQEAQPREDGGGGEAAHGLGEAHEPQLQPCVLLQPHQKCQPVEMAQWQ